MADDTLDTLTNIEAKVLCKRYGIDNIDDLHNVKDLELSRAASSAKDRSISQVARELGHENNLVEKSERSALQKLNVKT